MASPSSSRSFPRIPGHALIKKATVSSQFNFRGKEQAIRFNETLRDCPEESKPELLNMLDKETFALLRLVETISFCQTARDIESIVIPLLQFLHSKILCRPLYATATCRLMRGVYSAPFFVDVLDANLDDLRLSSKNEVCHFLRCMARMLLEVRGSRVVKGISERC